MSPETVGPSIPRVIEKNEVKLVKYPDDQELILETGSLYVMYANAFIQGPAEFFPPLQYQERLDALDKAQKYYLRGADILFGGLNKKYPGFDQVSTAGNTLAPYLAKMEKDDVPSLYWTAAGYLSAYSLDPFNLKLGRRVPDLLSYIDRAYELDSDFNLGALDDFYVLALSSLPEPLGGDKTRVDTYFHRALEKSGGKLAGPYVSYAQSVCIPNLDYPGFKKYLEAALAIDSNSKENTSNRLVNTISQRKARNLLDHTLDYFIDLEDFDSAYVDSEDVE
jgi:predicted anti-sigma-YlaC factor YlaD